MVRIDLENAYARLGVSPLMPTDEIKEIINRRRKDLMRLRRTRGEQRFGEEEAEMTRLQAIEDEIGTPKARGRYDRLNPQNALLTIQPGERPGVGPSGIGRSRRARRRPPGSAGPRRRAIIRTGKREFDRWLSITA